MLAKRMVGSILKPEFSIELMRSKMEKATKMAILPANTKVDKIGFNGLSAELITTETADRNNYVLYLHGGGYNSGSPATHREFVAHISKWSRSKVLVPSYRLAPEHPFPAALEDALASYQWLLDKGLSNKQISIAGESAGGGLTLATCLSLRDRGFPLPSSLVCISPWTDLEMTGESITTLEKIDPVLNFAACPSGRRA